MLEFPVQTDGDDELTVAVGDCELCLRTPGEVPRGGLHTHYALSASRGVYDDWYDRFGGRFDLEEHRFGDARSLYCYDPEGNCVELGETVDDGTGIQGLFDVVLEVESLSPAVEFYDRLGFEVVDRGSGRRRVRMTTGAVELELWEPQPGLADARGGVHVDWGIEAEDPTARSDRVAVDAPAIDHSGDRSRIRDPDGHYLTLFERG